MDNGLNEQNNFIMYTTDDGQVDIEVRLEEEMYGLLKIQWLNYLILRNKI